MTLLVLSVLWLLAGLVCVAVCWHQSSRPFSELDRYCSRVDRWAR